jgi:hypothetical protein
MNPTVESAIISAAATVVGIGATATIAIVGFRLSRSASDKAVAIARETNLATIEAARADVQATLQTTRDGQIADLYGKAVEQLGSEKLDVRIGGIYALERIARDSARDHPTVIEVLSAFIREHSREPWPQAEPGADPPRRETRPDVQAALTVIGRRDRERDARAVDLSRANLTGADLSHGFLPEADLTNACLIRANLSHACLVRAFLTGVDLADAGLFEVDLTSAFLYQANFTNADLGGADLTDANLERAKLTNAHLAGADFTGAQLKGADFTGADLTWVVWPEGQEIPTGWQLDVDGKQLKRADSPSTDEPTK